MKKNIILLLICIFSSSFLFAERVYIELPNGYGRWFDKISEWYDYNSKGVLIHEKDSDGYEAWYNNDGKPIRRKFSTGKEEIFEYANNVLIYHKESNGNETWYNNQGQETHTKSAYGSEEYFEYDKNGNLVHSKYSDGRESWIEYDSKNREIHAKFINYVYGNAETWTTYDEKGKHIHCIRTDGVELWFDYDSKGHIIYYKEYKDSKKIDECTTEYCYDKDDNIIWEKDSSGEITYYQPYEEYDINGNIVLYKYYSRTEWYEYYKNGNKKYQKDSNGIECWFNEDGYMIKKKDFNNNISIYEYSDNYDSSHCIRDDGFESWTQYYENGKTFYYKDNTGEETKYNTEGKIIYSKNNDGYEEWRKYNDEGEEIYYENSDGEIYKYEALNKISPLINKNDLICIYYKNSDGYESWLQYDTKKQLFYKKDSLGSETIYDKEFKILSSVEYISVTYGYSY